MAQNTIIRIPSQNQEYRIPNGTMPIPAIQTAYAADIPGLQSMVGVETTEGDNRVVTFSPRTGTKG